MFDHIQIILVEPSHPGNIGAAARAMKTMGLSQLTLVNPKEFPSDRARALASNADDILTKAKIVTHLNSAIDHAELIIGTSARDRSLPWPMLNARECGEKVMQETQSPIAIVFGRENKGLNNQELQRCHFHLQIPTNPDYCSLNLAQAVQVICYEIHMAWQQKQKLQTGSRIESVANSANIKMMEQFYQHLEKILLQIDFIKAAQPNKIMPRLRRLFMKARPDKVELNILRGILTQIENRDRNKE